MVKKGIEVKYQTLVVIWAALLVSQAIFFVLIYFVKPALFSFGSVPVSFGSKPLIVGVFALAAVILFALSFIFRRQYIARAMVDHDAGCLQTGLVLGCALCEGCSLLGVILALVFGYEYFFLWIAAGTVGILMHFPQKGSLDAATFKKQF
jgi:uncharacterized membrane protein (DUF485 family)